MINSIKEALLLFCIAISSQTFSQSIKLNGDCVGFIVVGDTTLNGSGFVCFKPNLIVTCAHVIDTTKSIFYIGSKSNVSSQLTLIRYDSEHDLALLKSDSPACPTPLQPSMMFKVEPRQHLFYIGYNTLASNGNVRALQVNNAVVESVGRVVNNNGITSFLEFDGVAIPGYSGGPVINDKNEIVGVISQALLKQGIKGGPVFISNRAFDITPLMEYLKGTSVKK